jgi:capsule polysaccharide export protein KpsE/RkpR
VQISLGKKDGLITVDVDDTDRARAAAIANDYVNELRKMTDVIAVTSAQQRRMFFERLMKESKERLAQAQLALEASGFSPGAIKTEPRAAADTYASLRAQLTAAEVRLEALRQTMADTSPEVQTQEGLVRALREQVGRLEQTENNGDKNADYVGRYREFKYQETLFDLLSRQYELARVDESRDGGLIQVVDPARPAEHKLRPQRAVISVTVALLSLLSWGIVLTLRERWRVGRRHALPN